MTSPEPAEPDVKAEPVPRGKFATWLDTGFRRLMSVVALLGVLLALAGWLIPARSSVAIEAVNEGLTFTTTDTLDLVHNVFAATPLGGSGEPQIPVEPQLVYLDVDTAYVDFGPPADIDLREPLAVQGIQHLIIGMGCRVQVDPLHAGALRITVLGAAPSNPSPCWMHANLWSIPTPPARRADTLAIPMVRSYAVAATPTAANPASISLQPTTPLEFRGIKIRDLGFQTSEATRDLQSSLASGTVRFPDVGNRTEILYSRDALVLKKFAGTLDLTTGERLSVSARGSAGKVTVNRDRISPSQLESAVNQSDIALALGTIVAIISALGALRGLLKK